MNEINGKAQELGSRISQLHGLLACVADAAESGASAPAIVNALHGVSQMAASLHSEAGELEVLTRSPDSARVLREISK